MTAQARKEGDFGISISGAFFYVNSIKQINPTICKGISLLHITDKKLNETVLLVMYNITCTYLESLIEDI